MNPTFTINHKFPLASKGSAPQLSDSVNSCLESTLCYSNRPVSHQTWLSLQKYNGKMESLVKS